MIRVFVSSVSRGLVETRRQVITDLRTANYAVGAMEEFGAQADLPIEICLRELRKADVVVLIIGPRYGSLLPDGISYTHAEFREARSKGIKVLAFRVPDEVGLEPPECAKVKSLLDEVGSTAKYDALAADESLDRLSARVQAALTRARDSGELGGRFSLFSPWKRFFAPQLREDSIFNHAGPFVGRVEELQRLVDFLRGEEPLLLLKAPGGSGKSRLLLEGAQAAAKLRADMTILFVDGGAQWSADDINRLPTTPLVLVFDDAHRRADLDRLMHACLRHNDRARFVLSCRPSAVGIVRSLIGQMAAPGPLQEIDLSVPTKDDAVELAAQFLGPELGHLSERLVRIADGNALVIRVGARCIAQRKVAPEVLERSAEEFRTAVLDRLLDDPGLKHQDSDLRRRALNLLAAIGPVAGDGEDFAARIGAFLKISDCDLRHLLGSLERQGFLARRGRLLRISPDVLGDHLLYRAAVAENGRPTRFVDEVIVAFGDGLLENILANAAELDWRASATAAHESVLTGTWQGLMRQLPTYTNRQHATLLKQLRRAALFVPNAVLSITEWIAEHLDAPEDPDVVNWGLGDDSRSVVQEAAGMFGLIATHRDFTRRACEMLWQMALLDNRPTNSLPEHPRRQLAELLKYDRRTEWQSSGGVHDQAVRFLIDKLCAPGRRDNCEWAVTLLGESLKRLCEANEWTRREFTMRQFPLAPFLAVIAERRSAAITCLRHIGMSARVGEASAALSELGGLLLSPEGPFGQQLKPEEVALWRPEAERVISILHEIATTAESEVVRFLARRAMREAPRRHWPETASHIDQAVKNCPFVPNEAFLNLLMGFPWQEQLEDYVAEERRVAALCATVAQALWEREDSAGKVVAVVLDGIEVVQSVGKQGDSKIWPLVQAIVAARPDQGAAVARATAADDRGLLLLRFALVAFHQREPLAAQELTDELAGSCDERLQAEAVDAMQWMVEAAPDMTPIFATIRRRVVGSSALVKAALSRVLGRCRTRAPEDALRVLVAIEWGEDPGVAAAVCHALNPQYGLDPAQLTDAEVDILLARIEGLRVLDGSSHEQLRFIAFASTRRPQETVAMLLRRVRTADAAAEPKDREPRTPLPFHGDGLSLPGVTLAASRLEILRDLREVILSTGIHSRHWLPGLFRVAAGDLQTELAILREWVNAGDERKIVGAARLMDGCDHKVVFSEHAFVADLLEAAANCGKECLGQVSGIMFGVASSGMYQGTPGEPMPRHVRAKSEAEKLSEFYASRVPARDFYRTLLRNAEADIQRDCQDWAEEEEGG